MMSVNTICTGLLEIYDGTVFVTDLAIEFIKRAWTRFQRILAIG